MAEQSLSRIYNAANRAGLANTANAIARLQDRFDRFVEVEGIQKGFRREWMDRDIGAVAAELKSEVRSIEARAAELAHLDGSDCRAYDHSLVAHTTSYIRPGKKHHVLARPTEDGMEFIVINEKRLSAFKIFEQLLYGITLGLAATLAYLGICSPQHSVKIVFGTALLGGLFVLMHGFITNITKSSPLTGLNTLIENTAAQITKTLDEFKKELAGDADDMGTSED